MVIFPTPLPPIMGLSLLASVAIIVVKKIQVLSKKTGKQLRENPVSFIIILSVSLIVSASAIYIIVAGLDGSPNLHLATRLLAAIGLKSDNDSQASTEPQIYILPEAENINF